MNRHQHENTKFITKKAKFCCYLKYFVLLSLLILKNYFLLLLFCFFYVCTLAITHKMKTFPFLALTWINMANIVHRKMQTSIHSDISTYGALRFICRLSSTITKLTISITKCERLFPPKRTRQTPIKNRKA